MATPIDEARELAVLSVYDEFGPHAGPTVRRSMSRLEELSPELGWTLYTVKRVTDRLIDKGDSTMATRGRTRA
jgi:hypothetical protein